jgi:putative thioredoxin
MAKSDSKDPEVQSVRAALSLAGDGGSDTGDLEAKVKADPADHQARFDLAGALAASGRFDQAADHLLTIVAADREWNDQAARKQLLTVFDAAGVNSDVARNGRRRLSSILFS